MYPTLEALTGLMQLKPFCSEHQQQAMHILLGSPNRTGDVMTSRESITASCKQHLAEDTTVGADGQAVADSDDAQVPATIQTSSSERDGIVADAGESLPIKGKV